MTTAQRRKLTPNGIPLVLYMPSRYFRDACNGERLEGTARAVMNESIRRAELRLAYLETHTNG